jgi:hypothetical protein
MAITTVRPNATASGSTLYTITGGSGSLHAALSDDSDSTYIAKSSSITGQATALLDFGTTTITSAQRVKRVRVRARVSTPNDTGRFNVYLGSRADNQNYFHSALAVRGTNALGVAVGPWFTSAPNGTDWSSETINGLRVKLTEYNDSTNVANTYELYVDVDVSAQPTVTVSAPTGTITSTTAPDVTWAYADTDNETQAYYEIKVFSAAQYGAGGFSADTSIPTWGSGEIASTDGTAVVGELLLSATYRAYVRVAKAVNGSPFWSAWAYSQFTINVTPPSVPTLAASWDDTQGKATLTVTGSAPTGYSSQYFDVHRSDDAGVIYEEIRNGGNITPNGSYVGVVQDYEAPRGIVSYYRARAVGVDASSNEFPSAWSTVQQVLITSDETWWFKAVEKPSINKGSVRVLAQLDTNIDEPNTVFRPLGSARPIVVAGPLQGEDGIYSIKTVTEAEWDAIYPLVTHQGTILVQDPYGNQKYIRITARTWAAESKTDGTIFRDLDLAYVEVDA